MGGHIRDSFINIASRKKRGFDVAALWHTTLPGASFGIETQHTFQERTCSPFSVDADDLNGRLGDPKWVGRLNLTFDRGPWSYFWGSSSSASRRVGITTMKTRHHTGTYRGVEYDVILERTWSLPHGVGYPRIRGHGPDSDCLASPNIFDEEPPRLSTIGNVGGEVNDSREFGLFSQYDDGRNYFLNLTKTFLERCWSPVMCNVRLRAPGLLY